jgi:DNA end-binding protein Ku
LVAVPVKVFLAGESGGGSVALNQLHKACGNRIRYKKTCPIHGEVPNDQIVSGFQFAKGQYVVIDPEEVDKLRTAADRAINVAAFLPPDRFDPRYLEGSHYFLLPDGPVGQKTYALLHRAMKETGLDAFAQVTFGGRQHAVIVRAAGKLLTMSTLAYEQEMKPVEEFTAAAPRVDVPRDELAATKELIEAMAQEPGDFDFAAYRDTYADKLRAVIDAKLKGKEVVAPPASEVPAVTNLMEALQRSLAQAGKRAKPAKLNAPSKPAASAAKVKRRKSS